MGSPAHNTPDTPAEAVIPATGAETAAQETATDQTAIATTGETAPVKGDTVSDDLAK